MYWQGDGRGFLHDRCFFRIRNLVQVLDLLSTACAEETGGLRLI